MALIAYCSAVSLLVSVINLTSAQAAQKGVLPDYGPGFSLGLPLGKAPPAGLYFSQKFAFGSANVVNNAGNDVGTHTDVYVTTSTIILSTKYRILGGRFFSYVTNVGLYHGSINMPGNRSGSVTSTSDWEILPIGLSWKIYKHVFISIADGFNPPTGSYNPARTINIGHDRWTFDQHINISYIYKSFILSANGIIEINTPNMRYNYTSGSTYNVDLTALRKFGHYTTGPVGYYLDQFGGDGGPSYLNGGKQMEGAVGWFVGYTGNGWGINSYLTNDVFARNIGKQTKIWVTISFKI
jgi:hypothetical protein